MMMHLHIEGSIMQRIGGVFGIRRNPLLCPAGLIAVGALVVFALACPTQSKAQSQSQNTSASAPLPAFEFVVASIKPSSPDAPDGFMTNPGRGRVSDTFSARNLSLMNLVKAAYGIPFGTTDSRITGAPKWLDSEKFDVEAKIDGATVDALNKLTPDQRTLAQRQMLQALLADRCKMMIHREMKDLPIFSLVITKNGPKLQEANPDEVTSIGTSRDGASELITGKARSIADLARWLSVSLGCPVLDKTGLTGKYDFKLEWTPDVSQAPTNNATTGQPPPTTLDSGGPSLFTAIQEQLGLKLESGKGPVEIIVIDHIERPSGN
jgi:uncharacterized protein (TIGR03435 family)